MFSENYFRHARANRIKKKNYKSGDELIMKIFDIFRRFSRVKDDGAHDRHKLRSYQSVKNNTEKA
jgi:hypothetical protein